MNLKMTIPEAGSENPPSEELQRYSFSKFTQRTPPPCRTLRNFRDVHFCDTFELRTILNRNVCGILNISVTILYILFAFVL